MAGKRNMLEEDAFHIWASDPSRTMVDLAEMLEIPVRTMQDWRRRYRWDDRLNEIHSDLVERTMFALRSGLAGSAANLVRIAQKGADKDAVNAMRVLVNILGIAQGVQGAQAGGTNIFVDKALVTQMQEVSTEDLLKQASNVLEGNITHSQQLHASKRQLLPKL